MFGVVSGFPLWRWTRKKRGRRLVNRGELYGGLRICGLRVGKIIQRPEKKEGKGDATEGKGKKKRNLGRRLTHTQHTRNQEIGGVRGGDEKKEEQEKERRKSGRRQASGSGAVDAFLVDESPVPGKNRPKGTTVRSTFPRATQV